jgi:hypothetical protein
LVQEVGATLSRALDRLVVSPLCDGRVVATNEDFRNRRAAPFAGSGVVGAVKQRFAVLAAVGEGVFGGGVIVAKDARQKPHNGVDQNHGGQFAAAEDVVADRDLFEFKCVDRPFIDAFVVTSDQEQSLFGGKVLDEALVEGCALGRQQHAPRRSRTLRVDRVDRVPHRLTHQHHARASTERSIVNGPMLVRSPVAEIVEVVLHRAARVGSCRNARTENRLEHLWKEG